MKETYQERIKRLNIVATNEERLHLIKIIDKTIAKLNPIYDSINGQLGLAKFKYQKDKDSVKKLKNLENSLRIGLVLLQKRLYISSKGTK